jgi:PEP-CTERM motif
MPITASAQLLVDSSNSAIGASASSPDAAHFQNDAPNAYSDVYVGYDSVNGAGYMDNTSDLTTNGAIPDPNPYDITGSWGLGVGEFAGGEGYFVNSGAGTVSSREIRVGDSFGLGTAYGEFYQQSSGTVHATDYITVGNVTGGTGKFVHSGAGTVSVDYQMLVGSYGGSGQYVQSGAGAVNVDFQLYVGLADASVGEYSITNPAAQLYVRTNPFIGYANGTGTFTQQGGSITVGNVGDEYTDQYGYQELYVGSDGADSNGHYDLQAGTLTVNGWSDIGRSGGTGLFENAGAFSTTRELRVGVAYDGSVTNGTFVQTNAGSTVTVAAVGAESELFLGYATNGTGHYDLQAGTLTVNGWSNLGRDGGTATFDNKGTFITTQELRIGTDYSVGSVLGGSATLNNLAGGVVTAGQIFIGDVGASSIGMVTMEGGTMSTSGWLSIGQAGTGTMVQNGGEIFVKTTNTGSSAFGMGRYAGSHGTFTQNHGSITVINDWFVSGVDGTGTADILNDSTILAQVLTAGQNAGSDGTITVNNPGGSITLASLDFSMYPTIVPVDRTGWVYAGLGAGATGTINLMAGSISNEDWTEIGSSGMGTLNVTGGSMTTGDNFRVGSYTGSVGLLTQTAGTVTVEGNDPYYTGNFIVAADGNGTYEMSGGLLQLTVPDTGYRHSFSYSVINNAGGAGHELDLTQDGNLPIGEGAGSGLLKQSGGTINVAANVFVGGEYGPGSGTMTMTGGVTHVGATSLDGGDMIIAYTAGSTGTVNLQGGTLDVSHGSGVIGAGLGTASFNFTGGTLRVASYNDPIAGGDLGGLTQNGATSLLDVTANDTTITGNYTLTAGTAAVGALNLLAVTGNTEVDGTFSTQITGTNIGKMAIAGSLTLGGTSVLDVQGDLATAVTHVIATFSPNMLTGMFGDANDATMHGYNVVYDNAGGQIILDELDGDANHDGVVNIFDINLVSANWAPTGPVGAFAPGNINHDTVVDIFDINLISANWNNVATNGGVAHAQPVPEPATLGLAAVALAGLLGTVRRKKS